MLLKFKDFCFKYSKYEKYLIKINGMNKNYQNELYQKSVLTPLIYSESL